MTNIVKGVSKSVRNEYRKPPHYSLWIVMILKAYARTRRAHTVSLLVWLWWDNHVPKSLCNNHRNHTLFVFWYNSGSIVTIPKFYVTNTENPRLPIAQIREERGSEKRREHNKLLRKEKELYILIKIFHEFHRNTIG